MNELGTAIFLSRIVGLPVLDGSGDQIGTVRDVVIQSRIARPPRAQGLVVELFARRRIFVPMLRIHHIDAQQITISGVVNTLRFQIRESEVLVIENLIDRTITPRGGDRPETVFDVSMKLVRKGEWELFEVALREASRRPFSRGHVRIVPWSDVPDFVLYSEQSADHVVAKLVDMKPADVARELHSMAPDRRAAVAKAMDDSTLAEALEELPEREQVLLISVLDIERAADVLEEMDPDDAADLIAELAPDVAERMLSRMQPEDAQDVRRLLTYPQATAGGLMTPEPVIIASDATVADALSLLRAEDLPPALAAMAFVVRPPLDAPTGRFVGGVHIQRLLREPPSDMAARFVDPLLEPLPPDADIAFVSRYFATYDLVCAPVVDEDQRLLGAVTVDDVLDHLLPDDWRGIQLGTSRREVSSG
ncbi:magnesium transporter MgtE N-terminal domain-containing protein [Propionicicella superfundia]|uniref:magnesium transporter MgtE N-terminal domain-containing protein n=1 Tax=Propionicicella superfundia TaxID=348582 RepID=UPI0003F907FE|nr:CBS domain-containing protein [Propionicicella superfundia]